jgi:O-antigen/teichoic acid export membrane protein
MAKTISIKKNFIYNSIFTASNFIFQLVAFPYASRILLPAGTGRVSFAISVVYYFEIFAQLGIPLYGVRACAKVRDNKELLTKTTHEIFFLNAITTSISYVCLFTAITLVPRLREEKTLLYIVSLTILFQMIGVEWLYKSLEKYAYIAIRAVVFKVIALVALLILVHKKEDYIIYGVIFIFATYASYILNFLNAHKNISLKLMKNYNLKQHIKPILVFFAMSITTTLYLQLNNLFLGFMKSYEAVGIFETANKIKNMSVAFSTALGVVLLPRVSLYIEQKKLNEFYQTVLKAFNFIVLLSLSLTVFFLLYARQSVLLLSGSAYEASIIPTQIMMPAVFFVGLTNVLGIQILVPLGKELMVLYSEISGAVANIIVNVLLIPKFGPVGSAIGLVCAECTVFIVQFIALRDYAPKLIKNVKWEKLIFALSISGIASFFIQRLVGKSSIMQIIVAAIFFFGIYGLVLWLMKEPFIIDTWNQMREKLLNNNKNK